MSQYDVHVNPSAKTAETFPYLLEVQSDLFEDSSRVVVVPMVSISALKHPDQTLNPEFEVDGNQFALVPLDIASVNKTNLGRCVTSLAAQGDFIVAALDLLLARR